MAEKSRSSKAATPKHKIGTANMSIAVEPDLAAGRYATMTALSMQADAGLLTFIAADPMTVTTEPVGHVVARVWMSHSQLKELRDLIDRQLENAMKAAAAANGN